MEILKKKFILEFEHGVLKIRFKGMIRSAKTQRNENFKEAGENREFMMKKKYNNSAVASSFSVRHKTAFQACKQRP